VNIFASGGLNEDEIARLIAAGAPIDGFRRRHRHGVSRDAPGLDIAYKLVEYAGCGRVKLSPRKAILPAANKSFAWNRTDSLTMTSLAGTMKPGMGVHLCGR
jgi:nicotinate phosphoribosyltransferase